MPDPRTEAFKRQREQNDIAALRDRINSARSALRFALDTLNNCDDVVLKLHKARIRIEEGLEKIG